MSEKIENINVDNIESIDEWINVLTDKISEIIKVVNSINEKPSKSSSVVVSADKITCEVYDSEVDKTEVIINDLKGTKALKDVIRGIGGELNITGTICNMECSKATIGRLQWGARNVDCAPGTFNTPTPWVPCQEDNIETLKNNKLI